MERDSDLFGVMFFDWQWPEHVSLAVENWSVAAMCLVGAWAILFPLLARQAKPPAVDKDLGSRRVRFERDPSG